MKVSKLSDYGETMPYKLVKSFIESPSNFIQVEPFLKPEYFDKPLSALVKVVKDYYKDKGVVPGYADIEYYAKANLKKEEDRDMVYTAFKKVKDSKMSDGIDTAADIGIDYIKQQEALRQLKNAEVSIGTSGYDGSRMLRIIEGLQSIDSTGGNAETVNPSEMMQKVFAELSSERVPTGIDEIDAHIKGGLAKRTTGLLLAGTGVGKTTMFTIMALGSATFGHNTLYICFEDEETVLYRKFYSNLTGRYSDDFYADSPNCKEAENDLKEIMKEEPVIADAFNNHLRVLRLPNGETTVDTIKTEIRKLIVGGWKPDVVYIDYLQCIQSSSDSRLAADKEYITLDRSMKRLDAFAQQENFALWVAQQLNRSGMKEGDNGQTSVQGSFRIIQTASLVLELFRNKDDMDYNSVSIKITKCRWAALHSWDNASLNNGNCQIDLSGCDEGLFSPCFDNNKDEREELGL